jgi:hypothetical protein
MTMKTKNTKYELPEEAEGLFAPDDLMSVLIERGGCIYKWGIPYKNFKSSQFQDMEEPYKEDDLQALGGVLLDILVLNRYSIDFKQKTGVRKLEVIIRSSESEDKQLLHKITNEFRAKDELIDKDTIPGTNNNDHE